ncbi:hypothetical protein KC906_04580 [Candidatus Kaiserbacteria bacterium]|nr:hypothetical protein [Candidatus Kaiserbacteria bacterium]
MRCVISSPTNTDTYATLRSVILPTVRGTEQVLSGHAEYITRIDSGDVRLEAEDGTVEAVPVHNAICWVSAGEVRIIL